MGLFSLISRKFTFIKNQQPETRAPPYERKPSARSPVRLVQTVSPTEAEASAPVTHSRRPGTSSGLSLKSPFDFLKQSRPKTASQAPQAPQELGEPWEPRERQVSLVSQDSLLPQLGSHLADARRRNSSIKTETGLRGYVDILDAHSAVIPADFRGRIRASGVREYGEDVADRNIATNNHDTDVDLVPDMHTRDGRSPRRRMSRPLTASAVLDNENGSDSNLFLKQLSMDSALWSRQIDAPHNYGLSQSHSSSQLPARPATSRSAKRKTLGALPSFEIISTLDALNHTKHHTRRRSFHNGSVYNNTPTMHLSNDEATRLDLVSRWDSSSSEGDNDAETFPHFSVNNQPILSPQPTSFRLSATITDSTFGTPRGRASMRHSFKSAWHHGIVEEDRESAPSPSIKLRRSISPIHEVNRDGARAYSNIITPPPLPFSVLVPPRSSSARRKESISSMAHTAAGSPPATFASPQSHHTTSTSADLGSINMPPMINPSLSSISTGNEDQLLEAFAESMDNRKSNKANRQFTAFNLDYYVSDDDDDDDSFIASQRNQGKGEEDLIFGGYGESGQQLPGLDDSLSAPAPVVMFHKPRLNTFSSFEDLGNMSGAEASFVRRDYEEETSHDILSLAMELCRNEDSEPENDSLAAKIGPEVRRQSVISSTSSSHDKIEAASAARLRREAKSRKRASLASIRSSRVGRLFSYGDAPKTTEAHQERIDEIV